MDELFLEMVQPLFPLPQHLHDGYESRHDDTEIRILGGKGAVTAFSSAAAATTSYQYQASTKLDQSYTSSSNQVGDKRFWSRAHHQPSVPE
jgi:hypothetical protein